MTGDTSAPDRAGDDTPPEFRGYDEMLATLDALLDEAMRKVESGRVYSPENERVRIKWIRVATQVIDTHRKVRADRDLEELTERVERLEAAGEPELEELYR
jgi:hypothetical protein